uniref:hypothetical protein n=1 Tax=Streptomyces venezuelae TaxID=54571 RepID=UPI001F1A1E39
TTPGGGGGTYAAPHYCDGCRPLLPQLPPGVVVPDGGADVTWSQTATVSRDNYTDMDTSAWYEGDAQDEHTIAYAYSVNAQVTTTEQYSKTYGANITLSGAVKGKIPFLAEGKLEVAVGANGSWAWTDIDTKMRSDTQTITTTWNVKKGQSTGLSPSGVLTSYQTTYHHADGRTSTKTWGTFDVTVWKPVYYSAVPRNMIGLDAKPVTGINQ